MATGHTQTKVTLPFVAVVLAMLPAVLDQTILATALPTIATEPRTPFGHLVGGHGICRGCRDRDPRLGQARRPPRAQAAAGGVAAHVPRRLGALRSRAGPDHARRLADDPGCGRGRADDTRDGLGRRPRVAARARALPGLHRRRLRGRHRRRSAGRRGARRAGELALGLLRQPPARPAGAGRAAQPDAGPRDRAAESGVRRHGRRPCSPQRPLR
jgi:hypothetical protein